MKLMKRFFSFVMCIIFLFSISAISVYAESPHYSYLLRVGFPSAYLDSLSADMILQIYKTIADKDIYSVDSKTIYLSESNNISSTYGSISEKSLHLDIITAEICQKGTTTITGVFVSASWDWGYARPFMRKTDALTINWDNNIFAFGENTFLLQEKFKNYKSDGTTTDWQVSQEYTRPTQHCQGGVGFTTRFSQFNDFVGGSVFFIVDPKIRMRVKSASEWGPSTNFNINYMHNRSPVGISFSFPIAGGSVSIQPSNSLYDEAADSYTFRYVAL